MSSGRPPCACNDTTYPVRAQAGPVSCVDGHFCLLPVSVDVQGSPLRSTDPPPPCNGRRSRKAAVSSLASLAQALNVSPLQDSFLSSLFPDDGSLRQCVMKIARDLSAFVIVRLVDKGPGMMWGFCRAWAWDAMQAF